LFDIDWNKYRLVDLSVKISPPGDPERPFEVKPGRLADDALKYDITNTHTHVGTHVESPRHFYMEGKGCEDYPLQQYMGRAVLLDVPDADGCPRIEPSVLDEKVGSLLQPADILLLRNSDPRREQLSRDDYPLITVQAARWMADKAIKMLGFDVHFRLGADVSEGRQIHDILLSRNILLIEVLDLAGLVRQQFYYIGLPINFVGLDSAWCRAVAIEDK